MVSFTPTKRTIAQAVIVLLAAAAAIYFRVTADYSPDEPRGVYLGIATLGLILCSLTLAILRKSGGTLGRLARSQHCFVGAMAFVTAAVHWQFRGRNPFGIAAAVLMAIIVMGYATRYQRRVRWIGISHGYLGYLLPLIVIAHAVKALIFSHN